MTATRAGSIDIHLSPGDRLTMLRNGRPEATIPPLPDEIVIRASWGECSGVKVTRTRRSLDSDDLRVELGHGSNPALNPPPLSRAHLLGRRLGHLLGHLLGRCLRIPADSIRHRLWVWRFVRRARGNWGGGKKGRCQL